MGKHSGRNALNTRLQQLGFDLTPQEVDDVFRRFKVRVGGVLLFVCGGGRQGGTQSHKYTRARTQREEQ